MKRVISVYISIMLILSLTACAEPETEIAPSAKAAPTVNAEATSVPTPTPQPTPTPMPFSYENIYTEVFSNEELSKLYPSIEDYYKERTRIYNNISRIEDFHLYDLTEEEQSFIKEAQLGNVSESDKEKLIEILTKIIQNDPHVFDDVDNEVKIENRIDYLLLFFENVNFDMTSYPAHREGLRGALIVNNCGNIEGINNADMALNFIQISTTHNQMYVFDTVKPDYQNDNWQGNYGVFPFQYYLIDGSEAQKMATNLYEINLKLFTSNKEDVKNVMKEVIDLSMDYLLINDALQEPEGINSLDSIMYRTIIAEYCKYLIFFMILPMESNLTYNFPNEYVKKWTFHIQN